MRRSRLLGIAIAAVVLVAIGVGAAYYVATRRTADVHNGLKTPFTLTTDPTSTATATTSSGTHRAPSFGLPWPLYGRTLTRARDASEFQDLKPPFRALWSHYGHAGLLEFPPSYSRGKLYLAGDSGTVVAYRLSNGSKIWSTSVASGGHGTATQPALTHDDLYLGTFAGRFYDLRRSNGRVRWWRALGGIVESSPAVWHGRVLVGDNGGNVWALSTTTGRVIWRFHAAGAVKGGPAVSANGRVYFGDYAGVMYCISASNGHLIWRTQTSGLSSGFRSGTFYSTPAIAYGRVYIGNTDDKVYSFVSSTGQVAWTYTMPYWAYGSPAVYNDRVYETSVDGTFVALNARTGSLSWSHRLPYRSLSSPVVVGPNVYVADSGAPGTGHGGTYAFNAGSGKQVWEFHDGQYSPVIVANNKLVLVGFTHLYVFAAKH